MEAVLISIQPKWCELIASCKKTIEVRKTKPKLETPFKVYIYCTKSKKHFLQSKDNMFFYCEESDFIGKHGAGLYQRLNGKVIGEFVCDDIDTVHVFNDILYCVKNSQANKLGQMCLTIEEVKAYLGDKHGYNWHISQLKIYDKPKELSEFFHYCGDDPKCDGCEAHYYSNTECGKEDYCCSIIEGCKPLKRPPQSWCYVEEK